MSRVSLLRLSAVCAHAGWPDKYNDWRPYRNDDELHTHDEEGRQLMEAAKAAMKLSKRQESSAAQTDERNKSQASSINPAADVKKIFSKMSSAPWAELPTTEFSLPAPFLEEWKEKQPTISSKFPTDGLFRVGSLVLIPSTNEEGCFSLQTVHSVTQEGVRAHCTHSALLA